jgi:nicastrin
VFAALAGEPWGYMGSKRLLWDMSRGRVFTAGLNLTDIDQVGVEINQQLVHALIRRGLP